MPIKRHSSTAPMDQASSAAMVTPPLPSGKEFRHYLRQQACGAIRQFLEQVMEAELEELLGVKWGETSPARTGYRNGYRQRSLLTREGNIADLRVPRDREGRYQTEVFQRYSRYEPEVREALTEMYVAGASVDKVGPVAQKLTGKAVSASAVSRLTGDLEQQFLVWQSRPLAERWLVLYADAIHYRVRHGSATDSLTVLAVLGVSPEGKKELLGLRTAAQEDKAGWWALFNDLHKRGVKQLDLLVTDGHDGLIAAADELFSATPRQRCLLHKVRNVISSIPAGLKKQVTSELWGIWSQPDKESARNYLLAFKARYAKNYPQAIASLAEEEEQTLTFYDFPAELHRYIRTTNQLESMFSQVRDRTDGVDIFPTEQSCLLLVWATVEAIKFRTWTLKQSSQ